MNSEVARNLFLQLMKMTAHERSFKRQLTNKISYWSNSSTKDGQHPYPNLLPLLEMLKLLLQVHQEPGLTHSRMEILAVHVYPNKDAPDNLICPPSSLSSTFSKM